MIKLNGLIPLYRNMISNDSTRAHFAFHMRKAVFDVMFFIDTKPFLLGFGVHKKNFFFQKEVLPGFKIKPFIGDKYSALCEVLGLTYNPENPFRPQVFFEELNRVIPAKTVTPKERVHQYVARYVKRVEEEDKRFFCGFRWNPEGNYPTAPNLEKTMKILGKEAHDLCLRNRISSKWTDDVNKMRDYIKSEIEMA